MVDSRWIMSSLENGHILRQAGGTVEGYWNETVEEELPLLLHKRRDSLTSACLLYTSNALCLFTPFEEFVNSSFSIPTLVYYLTRCV